MIVVDLEKICGTNLSPLLNDFLMLEQFPVQINSHLTSYPQYTE